MIKAQDPAQHAEKGGDTAHQPAREEIKGRWRHPRRAMGWYEATEQAFADLPEH